MRITVKNECNSSVIITYGTLESEQPIQRYLGFCWEASFSKYLGSARFLDSAHSRLFSKISSRFDIDEEAEEVEEVKEEEEEDGVGGGR